jgi:hypothetical protein
MKLFATQGGDNSGLLGVLFVLGVIAYASYHAYVFFARPDLFAEMQRRKHEKAMAAAEERKAKTGRVVGGILGGVAKAVLAAAIKGRPHH